jgi:hypothetical protein
MPARHMNQVAHELKKMDLAVRRPVLMFEGESDDGSVIYLDLDGQDPEHCTWETFVSHSLQK